MVAVGSSAVVVVVVVVVVLEVVLVVAMLVVLVVVVVVEVLIPVLVAVVLLEVVVFVIVVAVYNSSIVSYSSLGSLLLSSVYVSNNHAFVGVEVDGRWLERAEEGQHQQFRRNLRRRQERPEVRLGPRRQRVARTAPGRHRKDVDVWVEIPTSAI